MDPVYAGSGKHDGSVVFSMGGTWEVEFTMTDGSGTATGVTYELDV